MVSTADFGPVSWSADGAFLFAAGGTLPDGRRSVRRWKEGGLGELQDLAGPRDTVTRLLPCGSNVAISSYEPSFGLMAPDGTHLLWKEQAGPDRRAVTDDKLTISTDGLRDQL
jgi:hypothetical protein